MRVIEEVGAEDYRVHTQIKSGILEIAASLKDSGRRLRSGCPACLDSNYGYRFSMIGFHYVACETCDTLYVQNPLDQDSFQDYASRVQSLYSLPGSLDELRTSSQRRSFSFEVGLNRLFERNRSRTIGYDGRSSMLAKGLAKQLPEFEFQAYSGEENQEFDLLIVDNLIGTFFDPRDYLGKVQKSLKSDGYLYLTSRLGSGVDILFLGGNSNIIPTENLNLFTREGILALLSNGFRIKELSTPGTLDVQMMLESQAENFSPFLAYLKKHRKDEIEENFQEFVQKNLLSSYLVLVAQKEDSR
jgi:hypothetical protein